LEIFKRFIPAIRRPKSAISGYWPNSGEQFGIF